MRLMATSSISARRAWRRAWRAARACEGLLAEIEEVVMAPSVPGRSPAVLAMADGRLQAPAVAADLAFRARRPRVAGAGERRAAGAGQGGRRGDRALAGFAEACVLP